MNSFSVSVIIPVKNRARDLLIVLGSLAQQSIGHECIVVDQGSTDGTLEVAGRFGARVIHGKSRTVGGLRNEGILASNAPVVALIDSDHEVPSDWLQAGLRALAENPEAGVVGAPYLAPASARWVAKAWEAHRRRNCFDGLQRVEWLSGGNLFFRREDFLALGGFDSDLSATEDVDLCHRFRASGLHVVLDPRILNTHHGEPDSLLQFFRKQVWRGADGWTAWRRHGYPLVELKSLLFPLWVVVVGILVGLNLGGFWSIWGRGQNFFNPIFLRGLLVFVWVFPMLAQSSQVVISTKNVKLFFPLITLYIVFGIARFFSVLFAFRSLLGMPAQTTTDMNVDA
ncbi:MAG: glycosyltransferase [Pirellula sp.]